MTGSGGRRDAAASRTRLLAAGRELFAEYGYDRATVRAIAERAGVNQALLFRYFGSKDGLFRAVMGDEARAVLAGSAPAELLARSLSRMLSDEPGTAGGAWLLALLRSVGHEGALAALQDELGDDYAAAFAAQAGTEDPVDAALRADLLLAWLLGIGMLRSVLGKEPLATATPDAVAGHVLRTADTLLGGR